MKKKFQIVLTCLLPVLLIISVPWYRTSENSRIHTTIDGFPDWVAIALFCYALIPLINIIIWATCYPNNENDK